MGLSSCDKCKKQLISYIRYCKKMKKNYQWISNRLNRFGLRTGYNNEWDWARLKSFYCNHRSINPKGLSKHPPVHCSSVMAVLTLFGEQVVDLILSPHADLRTSWMAYELETSPPPQCCEEECKSKLLGFILDRRIKMDSYTEIAAKLKELGLTSQRGKELTNKALYLLIKRNHLLTYYRVESLEGHHLPCFQRP